MAIYEYDKKPENTHQATIQLKEIPIYGGSRLGQYRTSYTTIEVAGTPTSIKDKSTALGQRVYEFSNHLQNVLVVLADFKVPVTDGTITSFKAIVVSANDYYPFGMVMEGRKYYDPNYDYRYGFNGQEKSDELDENGNSYTAEFWQYDSRIARRWNVDPVNKTWESSYAAFANNPIKYKDINGDDWEDAIELYGQAIEHFGLAFKNLGEGYVDIGQGYVDIGQATLKLTHASEILYEMAALITARDIPGAMRKYSEFQGKIQEFHGEMKEFYAEIEEFQGEIKEFEEDIRLFSSYLMNAGVHVESLLGGSSDIIVPEVYGDRKFLPTLESSSSVHERRKLVGFYKRKNYDIVFGIDNSKMKNWADEIGAVSWDTFFFNGFIDSYHFDNKTITDAMYASVRRGGKIHFDITFMDKSSFAEIRNRDIGRLKGGYETATNNELFIIMSNNLFFKNTIFYIRESGKRRRLSSEEVQNLGIEPIN